MLITRTPVRLSFVGGGTDLPAYYSRHGGAVISTSINKYFYTVLSEREDDGVQVISSDLRVIRNLRDLASIDPQGEELVIPLQVLKEFPRSGGLNVFLASEIPPGTGLGSSAAVCVNVIKAVTAWLGVPMSRYELAETAFRIATTRLGRPVGKQDEYAAAFGGLNLIRFERARVEVEPLSLAADELERLETSLMLFFTGQARDSTEILAGQRQASLQGDATVVGALHGIKELVGQAARVLQRGEFDAFGDLLHESWGHKKRISDRVTTAYIDALYERAREAGARGGKIAGAGGGGFLLLYCRPELQTAVRAALSEAGAREMHFRFDVSGATVVQNDPCLDAGGRGGMRWRYVSLPAG